MSENERGETPEPRRVMKKSEVEWKPDKTQIMTIKESLRRLKEEKK